MTSQKRLALLVAMVALIASSAFGRNLPNIDLLLNSKVPSNSSAALDQKVGDLRRDGLPLQGEGRLGVPTVLWVDPTQLVGTGPIANGPERAEIAAARGVLSGVSSAYGLTGNDVTGATAEGVINGGKGPVIVKFTQSINGVAIFREELNVVMNQKLEPVAVTGYISSQATSFASPGQSSWSRSEATAAADALKDVTASAVTASQLTPAGSRDGYDFFNLTTSSGVQLADPVRMKKVYFHMPEGLIPAYYIEVAAIEYDGERDGSVFVGNVNIDAYSYVISASDGSILFRKNLTEDASGHQENVLPPGGSTYRVWADPVTGIPYDTPAGNSPHPKVVPVPDGAQAPFVPTNDIQLPNYPFSMNDPWIAPGATETVGNNADAYLDLFGLTDAQGNPTTNDGLAPVAPPSDPPTGDYRAQITGVDQFLHTHTPDTTSTTAEARQGSIQQLFYNVNFLHDWYYDSGFNESMRNAQTNNFGRGGLQNDNVRAEVQDYSGFANANMSTPSDGGRPRMQMYNFPTRANTNEIVAPANIAGKRSMGVAMSGTQDFDVTADVVMATFDAPATLNVTNAAALAGKIAMFNFQDAGSFSTKITRLHQQTTCVAVLMVYTSANANAVANIVGFNTVWTRPVASISFNSAAPIKSELLVPNTVTLRMHRFADRDGALDNQVVFHEWGHYISNRLISNSAGLSNNQGRSMGEGWGDFNAMMLTVREDDTLTPSNATWGGVYALATYATSTQSTFDNSLNHGYYLGIRRTPYSTDKVNYNNFTFINIMNGQPLPVGPPVANNGAANSEVHNSGEVWAEMLWECYASLLRDTQGGTPRMTFQQAQDRMKMYYVASLALTPPSPTFVEARDAMLAAAYATDYTDYLEFWAAFAKRGMGVGAVAPDRASTTHSGVVESFVVAPDLIVTSQTALDDSVASCDADGALDAGEYGKLTVVIKNVGSATLNSTTATISSTTPGVTFPNGNVISLPSSDPLATVSSTITVGLAPGTAGIQQLDFQISATDPAITGSRNGTASFRGNTDVIPSSTATDDVEGSTMATTPWTLDFDAGLGNIAPFSIQTVTPLSHRWFGPNGGAPSDNRLVSPVFTVDGSGSATIQWDHTWSFETNFDGGVIEMSVNGGAWSDVGVTGGGTTNGYNGTLIAGGTNPLNGRPAWTNTQNVTQHVTVTRAIAPGSTVRFRFRTGADDNTAGTGWRIDNIAFSGVVETPFPTLVSDTGCIIPSATALSPSANPSPFGSNLTLTATVTSAGGTPTGNVTFYDGATPLGTVPLNGSGQAMYNTSVLSVGVHSLTASYAGDAGHSPSSSPSVSETISKISSSTLLGSNNNPSTLGASVTFTATVSATSGTPTGSVTFLDGASPLATISLVGGVATYTTSALTGGSHTINANYLGSSTYFGSTNSVVQVVNTGSTVQFNPTAYSKFEDGGMVTLTVTRTGGNTTGAASVQYATVNGTAVAGVRYTTSTGTVNFLANELSKTFDVPLIDTAAIQGKQTFTVVLSNPNAATLGGATVAPVDVMDDDTIKSDFSAPLDGNSDFVWRNETTGDQKVWTMTGTTYNTSTDLLQFGGNWRLQGVADFNADGNADILYRNANDFSMVIWYMNGTNLVSTGSTLSITDANWKIVAIGDINGDGYPDIIWRHSTTFTMAVWLMKDNVRLSVYTLPAITDANWQVRGMGDFNRDGQLDIVWRNVSANITVVWLMTPGGATRASISTITPSSPAPWDIVGVGDLNADGDADLIWQASTTRTVAVWLMNQTARSSVVVTPTINDPNWTIVAPR
jgi:hypothetical protein